MRRNLGNSTGSFDDSVQWEFSEKAHDLIRLYQGTFPWLFQAVDAVQEDKIPAEDIFTGTG